MMCCVISFQDAIIVGVLGDRSDTCPYMPESFEDWIKAAKQMGPALPQVTKATV